MKDVVMLISVLLYNVFIIGGAAYLVVEHDWNAWTMLAALFFTMSFSHKKDNK